MWSYKDMEFRLPKLFWFFKDNISMKIISYTKGSGILILYVPNYIILFFRRF